MCSGRNYLPEKPDKKKCTDRNGNRNDPDDGSWMLLPAYGAAFGMPVSKLVGLGTAVNPHITSLSTFVIFAVAPFNLIKGVAVSAIVFVIYKKISPVLRMR